MASPDEVREFLKKYVTTHFRRAAGVALTGDLNLVASGIIDSFAFLELLTVLEGEYSVVVDPSDYEFDTLTTLDGLANAISALKP
jgi:acyl carrier protein